MGQRCGSTPRIRNGATTRRCHHPHVTVRVPQQRLGAEQVAGGVELEGVTGKRRARPAVVGGSPLHGLLLRDEPVGGLGPSVVGKTVAAFRPVASRDSFSAVRLSTRPWKRSAPRVALPPASGYVAHRR